MDEWISCYNRLPKMYDWYNFKRSEDVLIYTSSHEYWFGHFEYYDEENVFFRLSGCDICWEVTHETYWRDLPAPPKMKD